MHEPSPKKQLGQHWLHDDVSLKAMVTYAGVDHDDVVVEIGPGLGTLTQYILDTGAHVEAIEFDADLAVSLPARLCNPDNLKVTQADIMSYDLTKLPVDYKVVANIPYYLTSGLLRVISESSNPPSVAILLVQKEVAQRVCAKPGGMSLLSVSVQLYFEVSLGKLVPAELFTPPPKVDSQILILSRRSKPYFGECNSKNIFRVVKAGFSERRKKLRSSLSGGLGISKEAADELLQDANINGDLRAQNLDLDEWIRLAQSWQKV